MRSHCHKIRFSQLLLLAALAVGLGSSCTVDLRPDSIREGGISQKEGDRGRQIIANLPDAHGGLDRWRELGTAKVVLRDTWPSWMMRTAAMPWFEDGQLLELTTRLGTDDGRIRFAEPPNEDLYWGIQDWATYVVEPGAEPAFVDDDTIKFWVPTVSYFFEAPFRLHEADVVAYAGEETVDGVVYDKVFLSWGKAAPQDDTDQYVAWVSRDTGRLGFLAYTVRDMMNNIEGFMRYTDYEEVDGIWVAKTMAVIDSTDTMDGLHRMDVQSVNFGIELPDSYFYPDPNRKGSKH